MKHIEFRMLMQLPQVRQMQIAPLRAAVHQAVQCAKPYLRPLWSESLMGPLLAPSCVRCRVGPFGFNPAKAHLHAP
jgi:hypothetical protein